MNEIPVLVVLTKNDLQTISSCKERYTHKLLNSDLRKFHKCVIGASSQLTRHCHRKYFYENKNWKYKKYHEDLTICEVSY